MTSSHLLPTADELMETFRVAAEAAVAGRTRPDGSPVRLNWGRNSLLNGVRVAAVRLGLRALAIVDDRFRASYVDTAEGADLDAWAASEATDFPRKPEAAALVRLTLTRAPGGAAETIPAGSRFSTVATPTSPAVSFASLADVAVDDLATTATVDVEAEATGPTGNVDAATITRSLSPLASTWTVTNAGPSAGGDPVESDDDFRGRLRGRSARYRRGSTDAVKLGALSVPGVSRVALREPQWHDDVEDGHIQLVIGDARGIGSAPLAARVRAAMVEWVGSGIQWSVTAATARSVIDPLGGLLLSDTAVTITVTRRRGGTYDDRAMESELRARLRAIFNDLSTAAPLHLSQITSAAAAPGVVNCTLDAYPSGVQIVNDWPGAPDISTTEKWEANDAAWRVVWAEE